MFQFNKSLTNELLQLSSSFFSQLDIQDGLSLLNQGLITLSFKKGDINNYLIVTAIIRENNNFETKIVYKKRLEQTDQGPLSSSCNCKEWSAEKHCKHVAALLLYALIETSIPEEADNENFLSTSSADHQPPPHLGVGVKKFGQIIKSPRDLLNAPVKSTYSSLNYCLLNGKVINLSTPNNFEGTLVICCNLNSLNEKESTISFKHQYTNGDTEEKISIFEKLYLFNWNSGNFYSIPSTLKPIIDQCSSSRSIDMEILLNYLGQDKFQSLIDVEFNGVRLSKMEPIKVSPILDIHPDQRNKNYYKLNLVFRDQQGLRIDPPKFISKLTYDSELGYLSFYKTKGDACNFLGKALSAIKNKISFSRIEISNHPLKNNFNNLLDLLEVGDRYIYPSENNFCYEINLNEITHILHSLLNSFDHFLFKTIDWDKQNYILSLSVNKNQFLDHLHQLQTELSKMNIDSLLSNKKFDSWKSEISFTRKEGKNNNWFSLSLNFGEEDLSIIENANLDRGISTKNNQMYILDEQQIKLVRLIKKYIQYEGSSSATSDDKKRSLIIPFCRARIFELIELRKLGVLGELNQEDQKIIRCLTNLKELPSYPVPGNFQSVLRKYQVTGLFWLRFLYENKFGACLADDMGLGKTIQVISFLQSVFKENKRYLVVCPVSIIMNWKKEFERFSDLPVHIYHGAQRSLPNEDSIILTSYGVIKKEYQEEYFRKEFEIIILDEVQNLKNIRSLGAVAVRSLQANFKISLTGTPVENDITEFFNIIDLSVPGIWGNLQFLRGQKKLKDKVFVKKNAGPFILRRTKKEVLSDLPEKIEQMPLLEFSEEEHKFYLNLVSIIKDRIREAPKNKKYGEILRGILKLRQSCLWQPTLQSETQNNLDSLLPANITSVKISFLISQLEQILQENHQAIIFSQFTTYLDYIQDEFQRRHWTYSRIDGQVSMKGREKQINEFQDGKNRLFLISLKAGGVGLNLTAASYVFIMDPWWNPAVENQAVDRAHRIGQERNVTVYRPIVKGSVEEKIVSLQKEKQELFDELLGSNDGELFSGRLTLKDFEHILGTDSFD